MDFSLLVGSLSTQPQQYREDQSLLQQQQQQQQDIQDLLIPILLTALIVLVTTGVFYVFYPALSIQWNEPSVTKEQWGPNRGKDTTVSLSIVIPAYNEQDRLPVMLDAALDVLSSSSSDEKKKKYGVSTIEWVVVDDGSVDGTCNVVRRYAKQQQQLPYDWTLVSLSPNCGKGGAVQQGMLQARGQRRLMVDADGATNFEELWNLLDKQHQQQQQQKDVVVFGSRAHLQESSKAQRSLLRTLLMHAFHVFVALLCGSSGVRDTQCGFKLFTAGSARRLFGNLHLQQWAFDTELVVLCGILRLPIAEVAVEWREIEGSKLDSSKIQLALVSIQMLRDMVCVRLCYTLGIWKVQPQPQ